MRLLSPSSCRTLPLGPLLHAYTAGGPPSIAALHRLSGLGARFAAVLGASARFLYTDFLDRASDEAFRDALVRFHEAVCLPLHTDTLRRRAGFVRHALGHLLHGRDAPARKLEGCVAASGVYRVPGLGPSFWSALLQGIAPARHPGWTSTIRAGLDRLGLNRLTPGAGPADVYSALEETHARIRAARVGLTPLHVDHFLSLVAGMPGRDLHAGSESLSSCPIAQTVKQLRAAMPLRQRLRARGEALVEGQRRLQTGLISGDSEEIRTALAAADPVSVARCTLDWHHCAPQLTEWTGRLWHAEDPYVPLAEFCACEPLPGAGLWLAAAVLHLKDPQQFLPFSNPVRAGLASVDDGIDPGDPPAERYRLANEAAAWLRQKFVLHPLETADLLAALAPDQDDPHSGHDRRDVFAGFCADTFAFLAELGRENRRSWMDAARDRYHFAVRGPLAELCRELASRYIEPVLERGHGWRLDTASRTGRSLTSVCKNVFGKSAPYTSILWIIFARADESRAGAQLFVRLAPDGLRFGLRLGRTAHGARDRLRTALDHHGDAVFRLLAQRHALDECRFGLADLPGDPRTVDSADALRAWADGRTQEASCSLAVDDPRLGGDELVGLISRVFDQLLPLYACCTDDLAGALDRLGAAVETDRYTAGDFCRDTHLSGEWLHGALELLSLKKQLILQGVPGTGKTHVARCLARLLTGSRDDAVRLVQFHPAYSYEEFVEGIRVRSVPVDGRHDVTYPVEDGLLCAFAAQAAQRPAQPHVLLIDEINRGNLPRIFGELLYLLEYRGSAVELPYSRRDFSLPANLYLVATMNAVDRSIAVLDQALRRRFSFVQMEPDANVLASWLRAYPPAAGPAFASRVVSLFDRLNARLRGEAGPHAQVGHSYFMVSGLDEGRLRTVWRHHVRPLLDEVYAGQPGRAATFDALLAPAPRGSGAAKRAPTDAIVACPGVAES